MHSWSTSSWLTTRRTTPITAADAPAVSTLAPRAPSSDPIELDARRCISYWTIEQRGVIADENAAELNGWVFGCDICQDVCPWNRKAPSGRMAEFDARPEWSDPDLLEWLSRDRRGLETQAQGIGPGPDQTRGSRCAMPHWCSVRGACSRRRLRWRPVWTIPMKMRRSAPRRPGPWARSARTRPMPPWRGTATIRNHWSRMRSDARRHETDSRSRAANESGPAELSALGPPASLKPFLAI